MTPKPFFKYWWPNATEEGKALAFYALPIGDSYSDVTADTLRELHLEIPETPPFETWKQEARP